MKKLSLLFLMLPQLLWAKTAPPIGANLELITDWARSNAFVDLVKQSRIFCSPDRPWAQENPAPLDANGWPTADFGFVAMTGGKLTNSKVSTYKLYFSGEAKVGLVSTSGKIENYIYDKKKNESSADIVLEAGTPNLMLSFKKTQGKVKNIRVLRPGYSQNKTPTFTKEYLNHLKRFNVLRFMDWAQTNGQNIVNWNDRSLKSNLRYSTSKGVPWELAVELANLLNKDMWVNIPHAANDDYVLNLAKLLKAQLKPSLHIYLEYSNEVWNWSFAQATWNLAAAKTEVASGNSSLNYDGSTNQGYWAFRRVAKRIKEITDIFQGVFNDPSLPSGILRPVFAAQIGNMTTYTEGLNFLNSKYGVPKNYIYCIAGAPYINLGDANKNNNNMTKAQVLNALQDSLKGLDKVFKKDADLAKNYGLKFCGYEGGPDTFGSNSSAAKETAAMDPAMKGIVKNYLAKWYSFGFDQFNWYTAGAAVTWGLTNYMGNEKSPKLLGLDEYIKENTH